MGEPIAVRAASFACSTLLDGNERNAERGDWLHILAGPVRRLANSWRSITSRISRQWARLRAPGLWRVTCPACRDGQESSSRLGLNRTGLPLPGPRSSDAAHCRRTARHDRFRLSP
jgi:hypothetical protein